MKFNPSWLLLVVAYAAGLAVVSIGCGDVTLDATNPNGSRVEASDEADHDDHEEGHHADGDVDSDDHDDEHGHDDDEDSHHDDGDGHDDEGDHADDNGNGHDSDGDQG